jgi:hypothetical protein
MNITEAIGDIKNLCGYLDLLLDDFYDSCGERREDIDAYLEEIRAKYGLK